MIPLGSFWATRFQSSRQCRVFMQPRCLFLPLRLKIQSFRSVQTFLGFGPYLAHSLIKKAGVGPETVTQVTEIRHSPQERQASVT